MGDGRDICVNVARRYERSNLKKWTRGVGERVTLAVARIDCKEEAAAAAAGWRATFSPT